MKSLIQERIRSSVSPKMYLEIKKKANHIRGWLVASNLNRLASVHGTDKWNDHWYTQHYQHHFNPFRRKRIKFLEIGIGGYYDPLNGGDSLRMWKNFFPNGEIHGIDIADKSCHAESRIIIHQGSQIDAEFLDDIVKKHGPFDIIVDDGSHINHHVVESFNLLFPSGLKNTGIYVVEDTQTSYWENYGGNPDSLENDSTMMNFFKKLTDTVNCSEYLWNEKLKSPFDNTIFSMHFYHNLVFVYKGKHLEEMEYSNTFH